MLEKASEIIEIMQSHYCNADGLLGRKADCFLGKLDDQNSLVDELGDFCQYAIELGYRTENKNYVGWGKNQVIKCMELYQSSDGLIYNNKHAGQKNGIFFPTVRMGDTFWGLQEVFRLTKDERIRFSFDRLVDRILQDGCFESAPTYGITKFKDIYFALPIAEPMTSGYIGETLIEMFHNTNNDDYLNKARELLLSWRPQINRDGSLVFLRKTLGGLFTLPIDLQFRIRGRPSLSTNILTKGDVFLLFSLLALFRVEKNQQIETNLNIWVDYIENCMTTNDGRFFNHYDTKRKNKYSVKLEENHSIVELLIDIYFALGNSKALRLAKNNILAWHKLKHPSGLIANQDNEYWAEIDPFLDLLINTAKVAELTNSEQLLSYYHQGMLSLTTHFRAEYGYAHKSNLNGKGPMNGKIETKYLGLLMKGFILSDSINRGDSLFKSRHIRLLSTDR